MLQLDNRSPFAPSLSLFPDENGIDTLYVVVKGTFQIGESLSLADEQIKPTEADEYFGEPGASSLKYASEMHLRKPSTDVVLIGQAWPRSSAKVDQLDVTLVVAERRKTVRVFGNREWRRKPLGFAISKPRSFESMPLVYERAFGGHHPIDSSKILAEDRNPLGVGFRGERRKRDFVGQTLPNIETPDKLIRSPGDSVPPAGFGFIAPSWSPRRNHAGTYDSSWQEQRAPYLPTDFDSRFFNAAHPDFIFNRYLQGGEPVQVINACHRGPLRFRLPTASLRVDVKIAGTTEELSPALETVLIEPDEDRLLMTWRASLPCDKKTLKVETVRIELSRLDLEARVAA